MGKHSDNEQPRSHLSRNGSQSWQEWCLEDHSCQNTSQRTERVYLECIGNGNVKRMSHTYYLHS